MRWRSLRNIVLVLGSIGLGVFLSSLLLLSLYEDEFGAAVVDQLKKNVQGELIIEDQSFTLWRSFPLVSCDLRKVEIRDQHGKPVIDAEILGLRLNLYNLLRKSLQIENILIRNGLIRLEYNQQGQSNLEILTGNAEEEQGYFKDFNLDYVRLEDMDLIALHRRDDWDFRVAIDDAEFNYHQKSAEKKFEVEGELVLEHFTREDWHMEQALEIDTELRGQYNGDSKDWHLYSKKLRINGDEANIKLQWPSETPEDMKLDFAVLEGDFKELIQILFSGGLNPDEYRMRGNYTMRLKYDEGGALDINGEIRKGYFEKRTLGEALENISTNISIQKGAEQTWEEAVFKAHDLKLSSEDLNITIQAEGKNLVYPEADIGAEGTLSLKSLLNLFDPGALEVRRGIMSARGLSCTLKKEDTWQFSGLKGMLALEQIFLEIGDHEIETEAANIELKEESMVMAPTAGTFNGESFQLGLRIPSIKTAMAERRLPLSGHLEMKTLRYSELTKLIGAFQSKDISDTTEIETQPWVIDGDLLIDLEKFQYDQVDFHNCAVDLEFEKEKIDFFFETTAFEGSFKGNGLYKYEEAPELELQLLSEQVEIRKVLEAFEDFDQEVITYKNIKGKTDAHSVVRAFWDEQGTHLMDELEVYSDLDIQNGELIGVDMLYQFSNWIKLRDLMHIKFTSLQNRLEISDRRIYIPHMFVQSNAMNLSFAGEHSFENEIDYSFKINAGQVLWNKVRKYATDKSPLPAKKDGMFNMFFKLRGTVENYEVDNDRSAVRTHFKNSLVHEEIIYKELKRAFPGLPRSGEEPDLWMDMGFINSETRNVLQGPGLQKENLVRSPEKEEFIEGF
ncbi:MAG TPA: AsmA-like C-terminal region-containing protein [Saprospiraceae bacterium]|nr:AsmA-like C-terminal region-containing protein [Saprospiraceae bacterium]